MKLQWKKLIISLIIPLAVGGLATALSGGMMDYGQLNQPPLSPPGWLFPIVWTALYLMMGYASYRIWVSDVPADSKRRALGMYAIQLFLNFLWPILFFRFDLYLASFFLLLLLWLAIFITMRLFTNIDERAADLLLPYLLWVSFAGYLNLGVYFLN